MNSAIPYNKLTQLNKQEIINLYYAEKELSFKDISIKANVSERAVSRVLREANINTRLKNKYTIKNENYFDCIDTEFKAYILGFICADGYIGVHDDFCMVLSDIHDENYNTLKHLKDELDTDLTIQHRHTKEGYGNYTFKFSNSHIVSSLINLGITHNKLKSRTSIPNIPHSLIRHFIRGLFDGDGSICRYWDNTDNRERIELSFLGNPNLLLQVAQVIEHECNAPIFNYKNVRRIENLYKISSRGLKKISLIKDYLYNNANYYLDYKHERFYTYTQSL